MKTKLVCLLLLLVSWCPPSTMAQDRYPLSERILDSVAKRQKQWEFKDTNNVPGMALAGYDLLYLQWQHGGHPIETLIWVYASVDDAKKQFSEGFEHNPSFSEIRKLDKTAPNLGVDNYLLQGFGLNEGQRGVIFRKGRVFVYISAYSEEDAAKLASYIVPEIDP